VNGRLCEGTTVTAILTMTSLGCLAWCLYRRRISWNCYGERPITLAVALMLLSLAMLVPPFSMPLNLLGHALTGRWNVQGLLAHGLCIAADAAIVYHITWRARYDADFRRAYRTHVELPGTLAFALMFALWLSGNGSTIPVASLYLVPLDATMRLYWLVLCAVLAWMMAYAMRWMIVLRQDPRSRPIVNIYIFAGSNTLLALLVCAAWNLTLLDDASAVMIATSLSCIGFVGFATGAATSWSRKREWLCHGPLKPVPDAIGPRGDGISFT
jgi:hypothetical protein